MNLAGEGSYTLCISVKAEIIEISALLPEAVDASREEMVVGRRWCVCVCVVCCAGGRH